MEENEISGIIVDAAIKVHKTMGPGLLESAYEVFLHYELTKRGLMVQRQVALPVIYDGVTIDAGYRLDLLVEGKVIVELKAVLEMHPIFEAQIISYLKLSKLKLGLLINFHEKYLRDGIYRRVNGL